MNTKQRNVTDIIDLEYLQSVQDSIGRITDITTALLDPNGVPISRPVNLFAFCEMMQARADVVKLCMKTNSLLIEQNIKTRNPAIVTCPNSGLKTAAVPIFLNDEFLGSWLIGQIRMDDIDYALIEATATKAGLSKEEARKNIEKLPIISQNEFDNILSFLVTSTKSLTDMVYANEDLNNKNEELLALTVQLDNSLQTMRGFISMVDLGTYLVDYETGEVLMSNNIYKELMKIAGNADDYDFYNLCPREKLLDENGEPSEPYEWEHYDKKLDMWLKITCKAMRWVDGRMSMMVTFMDITDRKKEEQRIAYLAYNDSELDIPNAAKLLAELQTYSENDYIIFFDLRDLKEINNMYGRTAGDNLLQSIVSYAKEQKLSIFRLKGNDFAILVHECTEAEAIEFGKRFFARFDQAWVVKMDDIEQRIYTIANVAVLRNTEKISTYSELVNLAEKVLLFAKTEGKPILFDEKMDEEFNKHMSLVFSLKTCILNGMQGFSVSYQPVIDAKTEKWIGVEALCRWMSPEVGSVPPLIFIDEAEHLGLISILGDWVLEESISQTKEWGLDKLPEFFLSVNLSPVQLRDQELSYRIKKLLDKYDFPVEKLSLEITENVEVNFDEKTQDLLVRIREIGTTLSLDDFGTGYSTFSNLKNLPVNLVKTDRSFLNGVEENEQIEETLRIIIDFAHASGLSVTAEGVETIEQYRIVKEKGVNSIQGFYFSKPLSKEDLTDHLYKFGL